MIIKVSLIANFGIKYKKKNLRSYNLQFILTTVFLAHNIYSHTEYMGHALAQLIEALRYKPEGRGFDFRWCHWIFFY